MIMTRPLRLMILHFSHIGFTEGLTFIVGSSNKILLTIRRRRAGLPLIRDHFDLL